jgi:hypothetical protein
VKPRAKSAELIIFFMDGGLYHVTACGDRGADVYFTKDGRLAWPESFVWVNFVGHWFPVN